MLHKTLSQKLLLFIFPTVLLICFGCAKTETEKLTEELTLFIADYEAKVIPLQKEYNIASYMASTTGDEKEYKTAMELKIMLSRIYANQESFKQLKRIKESKLIQDTLLARQLDVLYNLFLPNQIDETKLVEMITLENEIKQAYETFRPVINGNEVTDNQIDEVLRNSKDPKKLEKYWRASKKIGRLVDDKFIQLVKLRNEAAKELKFNNFHEMMLAINGQKTEEIDKIFNDLDILTQDTYTTLKEEIDLALALRYDLAMDQLKPWHYQNRYFQQAPAIYDVDFDTLYSDKNFVSMVGAYFEGIGMNVTSIYEISDLFEKEGKSQLSFATDIDRKGDVRVSTSIVNTQSYMNIFLYETGFATYLKYIDKNLPYILHQPPQFAANDAIATLFSNLSINPAWLEKIVGISPEQKDSIKDMAIKHLQIDKFVFCRWAQVMYHFEKALYENPNQNLNGLWWQLVEQYQLIEKPSEERDEPDWATKPHIVTMPCTYHNYMLGELIASQINNYINQKILKENAGCDTKCIDNPDIGKYMIEHLFKPGAKFNLNDWLKNGTGEVLSPEHFAYQYIRLD